MCVTSNISSAPEFAAGWIAGARRLLGRHRMLGGRRLLDNLCELFIESLNFGGHRGVKRKLANVSDNLAPCSLSGMASHLQNLCLLHC
jgi:hypothetical protein